MRCRLCFNLEAAFEALREAYVANGSSARDRISKKFAAYLQVEMERARTEFEEHRTECRTYAQATDSRAGFGDAGLGSRLAAGLGIEMGIEMGTGMGAGREAGHEAGFAPELASGENLRRLSIQSAA